MKTIIKFTSIVAALLFSIVLILPYTGLLQSVLWRMEPVPAGPSGLTMAEELGFDKTSKLLVVNSDDTAAHPTFTLGVEQVMVKNLVRSTSVIVNDRNDAELKRVAQLSQSHPNWGIGVHLMLTNEYQHGHPWSPVLSRTQVPSLYNPQGLAWGSVEEVEQYANPLDVEKELKAQVQKALDIGINVTHLDSHMGTVYRQSRFPGAQADGLITAAIATAEHFNIPMTINTFDASLEPNMQFMDSIYIIRPDTFFGFYELEEMNTHLSYNGSAPVKWITAWVVRNAFGFTLPYENQIDVNSDVDIRMGIYQQALLALAKPGLNHVFMHAAAEQAGMPSIPSGENHASGVDRIVRLGDSEVWSSKEMQKFLQENNFVLINYQAIREVQARWRNSQVGNQ